MNNKAKDAIEHLCAIGFEFDEGWKFYFDAAAEKFDPKTLWRGIGLAQILEREQPITVRGAFSRAVSAGLYPDTSDPYYTACGRLIVWLRRFGFIPYEWISDSTRRRLKPSSWSGLADFADSVAQAYRKDLWERQSDYLEVFVEKDAMAGVIEPIAEQYDVTLNVIRGHCSETFVYRVAEIWKKISKPIFVYYLGDFDPSGIKIEDDLYQRLFGFGAQINSWRRLAVTREDFQDEDYLGFPVKKNGARSSWQPYIDLYGDRCVEVDAIPANEIRGRIDQTIMDHIDQHEWQILQLIEAEEKKDLLSTIRKLGT